VQRLLAFLALQGRPLHRAYVAGRLWMDGNQEHAHGCLRTTLWRLPRLPVPVVEITTTHVSLAEVVRVDVRALDGTAERILQASAAPALADVEQLARAGELLPDWYDDWILEERDHLAQVRVVALEMAGERLVQAERYPEATVAALAAVHADPLRESAQRLLIRAYLGDGNVAGALRQFSAFRTQLGRRVGIEPSAQMLDLVRGVAWAER
jgi:DNA-binding SARP family transcriptional activator